MNNGQCFTILWQQTGLEALQVLNSREQWINVPPLPGTLVIKYEFIACLLYIIDLVTNTGLSVLEISLRVGQVRRPHCPW
jgi:isopenicillin N synthase-like dioxygenase